MTRLLALRGHKQQRHWLCSIDTPFSLESNGFDHLYHFSVKKWQTKEYFIYVSSNKFSRTVAKNPHPSVYTPIWHQTKWVIKRSVTSLTIYCTRLNPAQKAICDFMRLWDRFSLYFYVLLSVTMIYIWIWQRVYPKNYVLWWYTLKQLWKTWSKNWWNMKMNKIIQYISGQFIRRVGFTSYVSWLPSFLINWCQLGCRECLFVL